MSETIAYFEDEHRFLSNFYPSPFIVGGVQFPTVEHAFQSLKTDNPVDKERIRNAPSPGAAKRLGRKVTLREDWTDIRISVMGQLVRAKFWQNADLAEKLLATGDAELVEGNWWGDRFWGVCNGHGENHLGRILMQVRNELREEK